MPTTADLEGISSQRAGYDVPSDCRRSGAAFPPTGSAARYQARVGDSYHQLFCGSRGAIADVDGAVGHTACLTAADDLGYEIDEAEVIYGGGRAQCVVATCAASGG